MSGVNVQDFLDRYRQARGGQIAEQADEVAAGLHRLRADLREAKRQAAEHALREAPAFNVFDALGVGDNESVHSNFLAELLDPNGKHGQRTLFLSSFLAVCKRKSTAEMAFLLDLDSWADEIFIRREARFSGGDSTCLYAHRGVSA